MSGERIVAPPKSAAGKRTVVLPAITVEALNAHLDQYVRAGDDALVFTDPNGQPLHKDVLYKAWRSARAAVVLENLTIHDLCQAGATLAAWTGASTKEFSWPGSGTHRREPRCATTTPPKVETPRSRRARTMCSPPSGTLRPHPSTSRAMDARWNRTRERPRSTKKALTRAFWEESG